MSWTRLVSASGCVVNAGSGVRVRAWGVPYDGDEEARMPQDNEAASGRQPARIQSRPRAVPGLGLTAGRTPRTRGELNMFLRTVGRAMDRVSPRTRPRTVLEQAAFDRLLLERGRLMDIGDRL